MTGQSGVSTTYATGGPWRATYVTVTLHTPVRLSAS
jgi:hypothetical protein